MMKRLMKLILILTISLVALGCCTPGVGHINMPISPVKETVRFKLVDPDCLKKEKNIACLYYVDRQGLDNYNRNKKRDKILHREFKDRIDKANEIIAGD